MQSESSMVYSPEVFRGMVFYWRLFYSISHDFRMKYTMERQFGAISFIPGYNCARYPYCNSLYIRKAGFFIDPASNRDYTSQIARRREVRTVCLSQWHEDHYKDIDLFERADIWISEIDAAPSLTWIRILNGTVWELGKENPCETP